MLVAQSPSGLRERIGWVMPPNSQVRGPSMDLYSTKRSTILVVVVVGNLSSKLTWKIAQLDVSLRRQTLEGWESCAGPGQFKAEALRDSAVSPRQA